MSHSTHAARTITFADISPSLNPLTMENQLRSNPPTLSYVQSTEVSHRENEVRKERTLRTLSDNMLCNRSSNYPPHEVYLISQHATSNYSLATKTSLHRHTAIKEHIEHKHQHEKKVPTTDLHFILIK